MLTPRRDDDHTYRDQHRPTRTPVPYDRYAVGVRLVAFEALSRDAVDRCWEWVLTQDVETESAPARSHGL
jgi:hypothetical protein